MPRKPHYIRVPATIAKADINATVGLKDHTNARELAGHTPRSLRFDCFEGALASDGLYHGDFLLEPGRWDGPTFDSLPSATAQPKPSKSTKPFKAEPTEVNDGV